MADAGATGNAATKPLRYPIVIVFQENQSDDQMDRRNLPHSERDTHNPLASTRSVDFNNNLLCRRSTSVPAFPACQT